MRIVGGKYRSRLIKFPLDAKVTRPTKDMVREGLFNALGEDINDAVVLDLFAGSGALGLESLSRGAKFVYFVDTSNLAIKVIKDNLISLKEIDNAELLNKDYYEALIELKDREIKFNIVFLDPPYKKMVIAEIIDFLFANNILSPNGIIIIETDYHLDLIDKRFKKIKEYKYGKTFITIKRS